MSRDPFKSHGPNISKPNVNSFSRSLHSMLTSLPVLHPNFKRYSLEDNSDDIAHEAGFDALMTGVVYLRMAYYILRSEGTTLDWDLHVSRAFAATHTDFLDFNSPYL